MGNNVNTEIDFCIIILLNVTFFPSSGCEPLIQLYNILRRAPGVYGARFSGAGFRGCCLAFVDADCASEAASFVEDEYRKVQPELANQINKGRAVIMCDAGDCARVI